VEHTVTTVLYRVKVLPCPWLKLKKREMVWFINNFRFCHYKMTEIPTRYKISRMVFNFSEKKQYSIIHQSVSVEVVSQKNFAAATQCNQAATG
jgi:hypothetical protein